MTLHLYPEGDGAPDENIFTNQMGGPNIPVGYRGDVGLVGAPTPIRLVILEKFYDLPVIPGGFIRPIESWAHTFHHSGQLCTPSRTPLH